MLCCYEWSEVLIVNTLTLLDQFPIQKMFRIITINNNIYISTFTLDIYTFTLDIN